MPNEDDKKNDGGTTDPEVKEKTPDEVKVTDETLVEVGGEKISVKDLRSGFMKDADYTQKTQKLADERKTIEAATEAVKTREDAVTNLLSNPDKMLEMVVENKKSTTAPVTLADEDVATVGTLKSLIAQSMTVIRSEADKTRNVSEQKTLLESYKVESDSAIAEAIRITPQLKKVPFIGDTLKKMSLVDKPQDIQSMKIAIVNAGVRYGDGQGWEKESPEHKSKEPAKIDGIEPPGGSLPPPPDPKMYIKGTGKRMKIDYTSMDKDIEKYIQGMQERK